MDKVRVSLKCENRNECLELAEYVMNYRGVRAHLLTYDIRNNQVLIYITGPKIEVAIAKRAVMSAYTEWRKIKTWSKGSETIDLPIIMRLTGKPFISDALVEVLKSLGFKAELRGNTLISNAPSDVVLNVAKGLAKKLEELVHHKPKASLSAKALITAYAYLKSLNSIDAMKTLESMGAIKVMGHRILTSSEWRSLLRRLTSGIGESVGVRSEEENRERNRV